MRKIDFNKKVILSRMQLIEKYLGRLEELRQLPRRQFLLPDNLDIASWNLRCALEAVFDICAHILARIPGVKVSEYKQMALEMGRQKIVSKSFARNKLYKMGGYRNRLTHFYFEVTPQELYKIIQDDLGDFKSFLKDIKKLLNKQDGKNKAKK